MNPYDKMLNEIVEFNKYLNDIIAKGYRNDIIKLSAIYHMIKEFKEDSIEQSTICEIEYPEYELSDLEDETIDMQEVEELLDQLNDDVSEHINEETNKEPEIILYKNNKEYLNKFKQFMDTMDYY
jgi:hypothetical protein